MRTIEEIVQKLSVPSGRMFGPEVLAQYLPRELHKSVDFISTEDFEQRPLERDAIIQEMRSHMAFAWGKVENHRGISALRSVNKMRAWIWVLGDESLSFELEKLEETEYAQYGAPILARVCQEYGFDIPKSAAIANMIKGLPCVDDCEEGCGR